MLENEQLSLILGRLSRVRHLSVLRNTRLTNEFFTTLTSKVQDLQGLEMGGRPDAFQHNISLDGVENLCSISNDAQNLRIVRFEYCAKIGSETIVKLA